MTLNGRFVCVNDHMSMWQRAQYTPIIRSKWIHNLLYFTVIYHDYFCQIYYLVYDEINVVDNTQQPL